MFNMIIIIQGILNSEPIGTNDYRISKFILSNLDDIGDYNIKQIAEACYVSPSSISRYCRKIGFDDFAQLRQQFNQWPYFGENKYRFHGEQEDDLMNTYLDSVIHNLQLLKHSLSEQALLALTEDLFKFPKIAAFGTLHAQNAVINLQTDLLKSGIVIDTRMRYKDQLDYLGEAGEDTLILLFTREAGLFKRLLLDHHDVSQLKKPKIIVITGNRHYQPHKYVNQVISYEEVNDFTAYPFAMEAICSLIAIFAQKQFQRQQQHYR